ncbi:MAG: YtxH domain-containing protein [bacterium]
MERENNSGSSIVAFLLGGLVGLGVGLLIAPITGEEARERLKKAGDIAKEKMGEVKGHAEEIIEQSKKALEEAKEHLRATANTIKEAALHKKEELEEKIKA